MMLLLLFEAVGADILCEFFEVAFHCILYVRNLYPPGCFQRRQKYQVPVQMCCHPDVKKYINDLIGSLKVLLLNNSAHQVKFVILNAERQIKERFVFEIDHRTALRNYESDAFLIKLKELLRGFILKIMACDSSTQSSKDDTWTVHVHTSQSGLAKMRENLCIQDFSWVTADDQLTEADDAKIIPVKSMEAFPVKMQLYIEEAPVLES